MKKILSNILLAVSTVALLVSCAKVVEEEVQKKDEIEVEPQFNYTFGIGSSDKDIKSAFTAADKYVSWVEGDDFLGVYAKKGDDTSFNQKCDVITDPALSFTLKSYYALETGDALYAYYPYNYVNTSTAAYQNPNNVHLTIASEQSQDGDTFDSSAMPMVAKYVLEEDLAANTNKAVAVMNFANLAGVLDFKIYSSNATFQTEKVQSVTFEAASAICGEFNYNLSALNYETASTMTISGYTGTKITTTVKNASALTGEKETAYEVCMAVAPGSYTGTVTVVTDKAVYTYNVSSAKTVGRSQIMSLGVNLNSGSRTSINPVDYNWTLVKDAAVIVPGEWIVFAGSSNSYAMSTTQNENNRDDIGITKSSDALTAVATVQIFEVKAGVNADEYAFKAVNGPTRGQYIYAASSSKNYLRSSSTLDGNASWTVSVTSAGVATVTAQGTYTHNLLQFNSGSGIFSAYTSAQQGLAVYIVDDPSAVKLNPSTTSVNFLSTDDSGDDVDVNFILKNVTTWNVVNSNDTDFDVVDNISSETAGVVTIAPTDVNNTYSNKTATVTVSASGASDVVINVTQAAKVAVCTPTTATTTIPATISDYYTITVNSNVPWTASVTDGAAYVEDFDVSGNTTSAPGASDGTVTIEFKDNTGAARNIEFTITPNEVGCGLSAQTISFTQSGAVSTPLDDPLSVTISSIYNVEFVASWANDANASSYNWILSTADSYADVTPSNTALSGTNATNAVLNAGTWTLSISSISPALSTSVPYYFYVQAVGTGSYSSSNYSRSSVGKTPVVLSTATFNVANINAQKAMNAGNYTPYATAQSITIGGIACSAYDICKNSTNQPSGATAQTHVQMKSDGYIESTSGKTIKSIVIRSIQTPKVYLSSTSAGLASASVASYTTGSSETLGGVSFTTYTITIPSGALFFSLKPGATFRFYDMVVKYTTE